MKDLVCPYCGFEQDVKNVSDWVNHDGDTTNHECEKCKKSFKIKANISIDFEVTSMHKG